MIDELGDFTNDKACPKCGSLFVEPVKYTWWGGLIGPKMLHHTKCLDCKYRFNSKTRTSNTKGIVIYCVVAFVIMFVVFYLIRTKSDF